VKPFAACASSYKVFPGLCYLRHVLQQKKT
jgi:hypothetical protein